MFLKVPLRWFKNSSQLAVLGRYIDAVYCGVYMPFHQK